MDASSASTAPEAPTTAPDSTVSASTRWRNRRSSATAGHGIPHLRDERRDDARSGAPGDVEPRHRVAVPGREAAAALGPADHGEEREPALREPRALLARSELQVGLGPLARPEILVAVEVGAAEPVLPSELEGVLDAHAALLGGVDEEQSAERPERLAAEVGLGLLLEDGDALAGVQQFARGDEARKARSDHDRVGFDGLLSSLAQTSSWHRASMPRGIGGRSATVEPTSGNVARVNQWLTSHGCELIVRQGHTSSSPGRIGSTHAHTSVRTADPPARRTRGSFRVVVRASAAPHPVGRPSRERPLRPLGRRRRRAAARRASTRTW